MLIQPIRVKMGCVFVSKYLFVKIKLKVKFTHEHAMKAQRGSRGIPLLFLYPRHYVRVGGQRHAPAALPPGKRPGTKFIEGWVGPRAGLDGCRKSRHTGIRSPDRPARRESLHRMSYHCPQNLFVSSPILICIRPL